MLKIQDSNKSYMIDLSDLVFAKADGNYTDIYLKQVVYRTIRIQIGQLWKAIEDLNEAHTLVRIDRSTIINICMVAYVDKKSGTITIKVGEENVQLKIAKSAGNPLNDKLDLLLGNNYPEPKPEDFPDEQTYQVKKAAEDLKRTVARMSNLYKMFEED